MSTEKKLVVRMDRVYGTITAYPANEVARIFAEIAGTKTLKLATIERAKRLGFEIELAPAQLEEVAA
jgi:hypothetical protein